MPRLTDMKCEPFLIASTLDLIVAQRLIRCLDERKEEYCLSNSDINDIARYCDTDKILKMLKEEHIVPAKGTWKNISFFRPKPSEECPEGYSGRTGIHEVLRVSPAIKELIIANATSDKVQEQARKRGDDDHVRRRLYKSRARHNLNRRNFKSHHRIIEPETISIHRDTEANPLYFRIYI